MSESLRQLQHAFMDYLNTGETASLQPQIVAQGKVATDTRMAIYRNAYRIRLTETIETDHEVLGLYLGDDLFDQMARGYIQQHPSTVPSLRDFCDALPAFLTQQMPFSEHPILADIAAFERIGEITLPLRLSLLRQRGRNAAQQGEIKRHRMHRLKDKERKNPYERHPPPALKIEFDHDASLV